MPSNKGHPEIIARRIKPKINWAITTKKEKQAVRERIRKWQKKNKEKLNRYQKEWVKKNPEKHKKYTKKYYKKNRKELLRKKREKRWAITNSPTQKETYVAGI